MRELDPTRECGDCDECCTLHGQPGPGPIPCRHLAAGGGCGIYPTRPRSCRTWFCEWRYGLGDEADRPDKLGVVPHPGGMYGPRTIRLAVSPKGLTPRALQFAERLAQQGTRVAWVVLHALQNEPGPVVVEMIQAPSPEDR